MTSTTSIPLPALSDRVWDGTAEDTELINYWIEQERSRVEAGGQVFLQGAELEAYRTAAAMMPVRLF
jgi:hypothetical protein